MLEGHEVLQWGAMVGGNLSLGWHLVFGCCRSASEPEKGAARRDRVRHSSCDHPPAFSSAPTCFPSWSRRFLIPSLPCSSPGLSSVESDEHLGNAGNPHRHSWHVPEAFPLRRLRSSVSSPRREHRDGGVRNTSISVI